MHHKERREPATRSGRPYRREVIFLGGIVLAGVLATGFLGLRRQTPATAAQQVRRLEAEVRRNPGRTASRLDLAANYLAETDTFGAIEQLEAARASGSRDRLLFTRLAELYRSLGEYEDAAEVLGAAAREPGATTTDRLAYSQVLLTLGEFAAAADALQPLLDTWQALTPQQQQAVARAEVLAGRWEDAAARIPAATSDAEWLSLQGLILTERRSYEAAVASLRRSVEAAPQDGWNWYLLGRAHDLAGQAEAALKTWAGATGLPTTPPRQHIFTARLLARARRHTMAEASLEKVEKGAAEDPEYWQVRSDLDLARSRPGPAALARGKAEYYGGDPWTAESHYRRALSLAADSKTAQAALGELLEGAEARFDSRAALRYATAAAERWPDDTGVLRRRAELLLEGNRYQEARSIAGRLATLATPEEAAGISDLQARIALEAGDGAVLEDAARRNILLRPDDPNPYLLLSEWYQKNGQGSERLTTAVEQCRKAVEAAPENAEAQAQLGALLTEMKRFDEAVLPLRRALALAPRILDGVPSVHLAQIYRRQGRSAEAAFHERRYRRLRQLKDAWASGVATLQRPGSPAAEWSALGRTALDRHDRWIPLWAYSRAAALAPRDAGHWRGLAAAQKRLGRFEEALAAMRRAHQIEGSTSPAGTAP